MISSHLYMISRVRISSKESGGSLGCAPGCGAGGREFVTPTGLRVFK